MKVTGSAAGVRAGVVLTAVVAFALGACGPRVTSGDENSVLIESGPFTSFDDTQEFARNYCAQFGKQADVQGSDPNPNTLQDTYRFKCVEDSQ